MKNSSFEIVKKYTQKLKKTGIPINAVWVFGSYAKGKIHKGSDLDVCIVSSLFGKDRQKERLLLLNLREGISDIIEPHPYSPSDFQNRFDPLSCEVKNTGIRIPV